VKRQRVQQSLVIAQIAVSVILLTGAGLLTRTMQRLSEVDTGMDPKNMLTMEVPRDFGGRESNASVVARYERMQTEIAALPGVTQVGLGSVLPLRAAGIMLDVKAEGRAQAPNEPQPSAEYRTVGPGYFHTSRIPVLKGNEFTDNDNANSPKVVILNKTAADLLFPGQDALGRKIAWTGDVLRFIGMAEN